MSAEAGQGARGGLRWRGAPARELARLAWPISVSMLSISVMTLVDTLFVSRLGPAALAAVGLGGVTAFTLLCFPMGLLSGVKVVVAQAVGAGRRAGLGAANTAGLLLALASALAVIALGQVTALLLPLITASVESGELAQSYLSIRVLGAPAVLVFTALREHRHGTGEARWPMLAVLVANGVNIALDAALIFGLGLGVDGAAWATVAASAVQAVVLWFAPERPGLDLRLERLRAVLAAVWRLGAPSGLQFVLEVGAFTALSMMISAYSERDMAAHQIALQVIHFTFLPGVAIADAASVLTGQAVGADRFDLVGRVARWALAMAGGYAALCTVVLALGAPVIAAGFTTDLQLAAAAVSLLHVAAAFQVFDAANMVARGALRGTGDVRFTAVVGIATAWVLTPPLTWVLCFVLDLGAFGGWLALCAEILAGAGLFWHRLERGGWRVAAARARAESM